MTFKHQLARGREFSPLSILRALWKWKVFVLGVWLAASAGLVTLVYRMRPVYRADAVILVESQKIPETFVTPTVQAAIEARMDALKQQALSRERLWQLIIELDLYPQQRLALTRDEVVQLMKRDIAINLERSWSASRPGAFRVQYEALDPRIAANVANRIARFFITENVRQREFEAEDTSEFLKMQLAESERKLLAQEAKLKEFKLKYVGELPEEQASLLASLSQNRVELQGVQDALARAQQNRLVLENSLVLLERSWEERQRSLRRQSAAGKDHAPAADPVPVVPSRPRDLVRLESQLRAARLRYHEAHPEVQRLQLELEQLSATASEAEEAPEPAAMGSPAGASRSGAGEPEAANVEEQRSALSDKLRIGELQARISEVNREIQNLEERRRRVLDEARDIQGRIRKLPVRQQEMTSIIRNYETSKGNYESLLNKKLAADLAAEMERSQRAQKFKLLDAARVPERPVRPRRNFIFGAGSMFSLLIAASLALALELRKGVLLGEWELPAGTPILGRTPWIERV